MVPSFSWLKLLLFRKHLFSTCCIPSNPRDLEMKKTQPCLLGTYIIYHGLTIKVFRELGKASSQVNFELGLEG